MNKLLKLQLKLKKNLIVCVIMLVSYVVCFFGGYMKGKDDSGKTIGLLKNSLEAAQESISRFKDQADETAVELGNAVAKIAMQEELISEYKTKQSVQATIEEIRDINVQLFKEANVRISYEYHEPIPYGKWEINPDIVGYLKDVNEEILVRYYYGAVASKIKVENLGNEINISYDKHAFICPYKILTTSTDTNFGASILTSVKDDKTAELVNDVGCNLLSNIEDAYVEKLAEEFADSEVPVYINGKKITDRTSDDKIFVATNPVIDATFSVEE